MKRNSSPIPVLGGGILVVAALATVMVDGGWVLFVPALLAVAVTLALSKSLDRPRR